MDVKCLVYNADLCKYKSEWTLNLASVPFVGSKIVYKPTKDVHANVYNVDEVRFGDNQLVEVYIHYISDLIDYNSNLGSTQNLK